MEIIFWISVGWILATLAWWTRQEVMDRRQRIDEVIATVTKITDSRGNTPVDLVDNDRKRAFVRMVKEEELADEVLRGEHDFDRPDRDDD